ncbi:hypothetical protein B296_00017031 [Ensete ventricosum]|uniref:Uncharacterized protein n=1 Tax=Ensete ventricosum TaxID=4639 RepID=A0A427AWA0_ENSVE|nr:hypothetical protein B296_00017031 [Ensete ventricosum]
MAILVCPRLLRLANGESLTTPIVGYGECWPVSSQSMLGPDGIGRGRPRLRPLEVRDVRPREGALDH